MAYYGGFNTTKFNVGQEDVVDDLTQIVINSITTSYSSLDLTDITVATSLLMKSVTGSFSSLDLISPVISLSIGSVTNSGSELDLKDIQIERLDIESVTNSRSELDLDVSMRLFIDSITSSNSELDLKDIKPTIISIIDITSTHSNITLFSAKTHKGTRLYLLDSELDFVAIIDDYKYFKWHHKLRDPDSFTLKISRYHRLADKFSTGMVLLYERGDVIKGGDILRRNISVSSDSGKAEENWVFDGVGYGEYLKTRIATRGVREGSGYDDKTDNAESLIKYYVDRNVINPLVEDRKIPHLVLETDQNRGDSFRFRARFQRIDQIVKELCLNSGLGWQVFYDREDKVFVLQIVEGEEKPEILFTPSIGNIESMEFVESWLDFESVQFVAGQGTGSDRQVGIVTRDDYEAM